MQGDKDRPFGGLRGDLVWRDPRPVKSHLGQRFVRFNYQCTAPLDDFLIVQVGVPLRQIFRFFKLRFYRSSDYELVMNFENAWEGSTFDI